MENQIYTKETNFGNFCLIENDLISNHIAQTGCWEYHLYYFYSNFIQPDWIIIDGGANIGFHSIQFARLANQGKVYCYEVQPFIYNILCTNFLINGLSTVGRQYLLGLGNDKVNKCYKLDNLAKQIWSQDLINYGGNGLIETNEGDNTIEVVGIDSLNLSRLDMIKLDVQGLELDVLEGGIKTINQYHPILFLEAGLCTNSQWVREHGLSLEPDSEKIFSLLKTWGYTPYQISIKDNYPGDTIFLHEVHHVKETQFINNQTMFKCTN